MTLNLNLSVTFNNNAIKKAIRIPCLELLLICISGKSNEVHLSNSSEYTDGLVSTLVLNAD